MVAGRWEPPPAPYARLCCPEPALRELTAEELAALDRFCARALDDPEAVPIGRRECAAVERYEGVLVSRARGVMIRQEGW